MFETGNTIDMYMLVLASLSPDEKLDLIAKLSESLKKNSDTKISYPDLRTCFSGDWSNVDAKTLRENGYYGRNVEL